MEKNTTVIIDYAIQQIIINILEGKSEKGDKYHYPVNESNINYINRLIQNKNCDTVIRNSKFIILTNDFNRNELQS
jgi:hypothetical protein